MPGVGSDYVSNGALTCLSNIIKENEDKTWTIVSANDETQMGLDHGWHYETISFLRNMEYMNKDTKLIIPTKNVYFFNRKNPAELCRYFTQAVVSPFRKRQPASHYQIQVE